FVVAGAGPDAAAIETLAPASEGRRESVHRAAVNCAAGCVWRREKAPRSGKETRVVPRSAGRGDGIMLQSNRVAIAVVLGLAVACIAGDCRPGNAGLPPVPVTLAEDAATFTLSNGHMTARIEKRSGTFSLKAGDLQVIDRGYWSQVGRSSVGDIARFGS